MPDYGTPPPPVDTVTLGGGAWNDPREPKGKRTWWYVGGGTIAAIALVAGGTVYAASQVNHDRDPGAAAGLPADTLAYAALDLDPSLGQKIEAIKALTKFPAFTKGVKVDPTSDLRKLMLDDVLTTPGCDLQWDKDVSPWLGNDVAAAVVPTVSGGPQPVAVLAVTDEGAATKDLPKLLACMQAPHGLSIADGWAVVASNDSIAKSVTSVADGSSLADDADFKTWTGRTGDDGVATFYASPDAGTKLASSLDSLDMLGLGLDSFGTSSGSASASASPMAPAAYTTSLEPSDPTQTLRGVCPNALNGKGMSNQNPLSGAQLDAEKQQLRNLKGAAATLRFAHSGFELDSASQVAGAKPGSGTAGLADLPSDTAVAFGFAGAGQMIDTMTDAFAQGFTSACGGTPEKLWQAISEFTGLAIPADLHTLLDRGVTFALSGSTDPEKLVNGGPGDLPAGIKIQGDPDQIASVLGKIKLPGAQQILTTTKGDGVVAAGPDSAYRDELLKSGSLGDSKEFTDVVPEADKANAAFFVSFDNLRPILDSNAADVPADVRDNLAHLQAFGESSWTGDDGVTHGLIRLSTK
jgi:hypothetical protein